MDYVFDKRICLANIDYLAKKKNINRKQLEEAAGVSQGYISRLMKDGNSTKLTVDVIMNIAHLLNVTPNTLLLKPLDEESEKVAVKIEFIYKLISETKSNRLKWFHPDRSFNSMRVGSKVYNAVGNAFMCRASDGDVFVLVKVKSVEDESTGYCIALAQNNEFINMCFTLSTDKMNYAAEMEELYKLAVSSLDNSVLTAKAKEAMQKFLGD